MTVRRRRRHSNTTLAIKMWVNLLAALALIALIVTLGPWLIMLAILAAIVRALTKRPKRVKPVKRPARVKKQTELEKKAARYGSPGTWMYEESKRWGGVDPRLYED